MCVLQPHCHSLATVSEWDVDGCDVGNGQFNPSGEKEVERGNVRGEESAEVLHLSGHTIGSGHIDVRKREKKKSTTLFDIQIYTS